MHRLPNIEEIAKAALEIAQKKGQEKTASVQEESAYKTEIGASLKEAADLIRTATSDTVTNEDLRAVMAGTKVAGAKEVLQKIGTSEVGNHLRKLAADLRKSAGALSDENRIKAAQIITAAVGLEHLRNSLKS